MAEKMLEWTPVVSETVERISYVPEYRDLLVWFRSGGGYVYRDIEPELVARLLRPHPWHAVGKEIMAHPYEKLASIRTTPKKPRVKRTLKASK